MALSRSEPTWMPAGAIEAKAEALLREYEQGFGPVTDPPVPIELLVEAHLGLSLDWCEILGDSDGPIPLCQHEMRPPPQKD